MIVGRDGSGWGWASGTGEVSGVGGRELTVGGYEWASDYGWGLYVDVGDRRVCFHFVCICS
ncbi:hypothetical protein P154DRAFT_518534 [Amniculicola lignicola CBS 123094]|uniref:Uncharacterized protein n=1 Tax=Amniculicola lignicola CBS 123094 TaxID=1392246 RepID=A0A6A5WUM8_9PLEO|nr:hypothetical protein P154DRAFT_518534 [Amniculicola lignicola CBS 123094]